MTHRFNPHFWSRQQPPLESCRPNDEDAPLPPVVRRMFGHVEHAPLAGPYSNDDWNRKPAPVAPLAGRPVELFIPESYEEKYAYPLLVWLHGAGADEFQASSLLPCISPQNYLGLSLRGTRALGDAGVGGFGWKHDDDSVETFLEGLYDILCDMRREYHVHSERIFLAGFDEGASLALLSLLMRPDWFGGAVALSGALPEDRRSLARYRDLQGKRVLLAGGSRDRAVNMADIVRTGRLLNSAGMDVTTRIDDAGHEITPAMLRHIDHWLMAGICAAV